MSDVPVSPDLTAYVPLAVYGKSGTDVATAALQDLATKLPGVTLREAMTETLLVETLATIVADLGVAVDRVPAVVFEVLVRLFSVTRDLGAKATTTLTFNLSDTAGHTIPAGTEVAVDVSGGNPAVVFATDVALVVPAASSSGTVAATARTVGTTANGIASPTPVRLRSSVPFVSSVTIASTVANGKDPETDTAYFTRAAQRLSRLTDALVLPKHFEAAALEDTNVKRAFAISLYDGAGGPPYTDVGHITVAVRGATGNLTAPQKTTIETNLEAKAVAMLDVHVIDPTVTAVNVVATVKAKGGFVTNDVKTAIEAAINAWLDPTVWPWSSTIRLFDVVALIENVAGVDFIVAGTLTVGGAGTDFALPGDAPLADVGTLTITVQAA